MRIERNGPVAVLRMEHGKANAIGAAFLERMEGLLAEAADARALVLTGHGAFFSAGLDLPALVPLDRTAMREQIVRFDAAMLRLFELPMPVVAAVNGHAVAGGCVLALQADVRIGADRDARIGLNEAQLGIGLPAVVVETLRWQVPGSSLAEIALEGRLFSPREALRVGLLHEVVAEGELLSRAIERAAALAALAPAGIRMVKQSLRRPAARAARESEGAEAERWLDTWFAPDTQRLLRDTVARLGKKG